MERLTRVIKPNVVVYVGKHKNYDEDIPAEMSVAGIRELLCKVAAYEDTGLDPIEIPKLVSQRNAMAALADSYKAEIPRWIPVSDRLPESAQRVIVCRKDGRSEQGVYLGVNGWWKVYGTNTKSITHWMPMPAPPEEV